MAMPPLKIFYAVMSRLSLETCLSAIIDRSAAQTHTQTHIERKQYLRHSLRSLNRDNNRKLESYTAKGFHVLFLAAYSNQNSN